MPEVKADDLDDVPAFAKEHVKPGSYHELITDKKLWKDAVRAYLANITFCDAMLNAACWTPSKRAPTPRTPSLFSTSDHRLVSR